MKILLKLILILLILYSQSTLARIGETSAQCEKRYGQPTGKTKSTVFYYKAPFFIQADFYNKKVFSIIYYKVEKSKLQYGGFIDHLQKLEQFEIDALLRANSDADWKSTPQIGYYQTSDGKLKALLAPPKQGALFVIHSETEEKVKRLNEGKEKSRISEF